MFNKRESENMETISNLSIQTMREAHAPQQFTPLELETRPTVATAAAAFYLHLAAQTMRIYACKEIGPLRPIRINGRLHWKTDDIRRLLSGDVK